MTMSPPAAFQALSRRRALAALAGLAAASAGTAARAQGQAPIRLILGVPAGSSTDVVARILAESMARSLGQPVIIDNRPGGSGSIATQAFLSAPRDGNTWLMAVNGFFSEAPYTIKLGFDPLKDAVPLVEIGGGGLVLVGNPGLPPRNFAELLTYVRANPGKVSYASFSPGSLSHVLGLQLAKTQGLDMLHVPYKGSPPALQDLMGGQVQLMFDAPPSSLPLIRAGKLRAFATSATRRSQVLPEVPTLAELGLAQLTRSAWIGIWTTPDAPPATRQRLRGAVLHTLNQVPVRQRILELGTDLPTGASATPEELGRRLAADHAAVGEVLRAVNYRPE